MFPNFPENNKDDDFLNEFRQKLNDQSIANFEEKKNEINRSKNVFIGAVSGIALAAVVGWFVLSPRYANDPNVELPVIRRPQTAVKGRQFRVKKSLNYKPYRTAKAARQYVFPRSREIEFYLST